MLDTGAKEDISMKVKTVEYTNDLGAMKGFEKAGVLTRAQERALGRASLPDARRLRASHGGQRKATPRSGQSLRPKSNRYFLLSAVDFSERYRFAESDHARMVNATIGAACGMAGDVRVFPNAVAVGVAA